MSEPRAVATGSIDPASLIDPVATARGSDAIQSAVEPAHSKLVLLPEEPAQFHAFRENINKIQSYVESERVYVEGEHAYVESERVYLEGEHAYLEGEHAYLEGEHAYMEGEHAYLEGEHAYIECEHAYLEGEHAYMECEHAYVERERRYVEGERVYVACERRYVECEHVYATGERRYGAIEQRYVDCEQAHAQSEPVFAGSDGSTREPDGCTRAPNPWTAGIAARAGLFHAVKPYPWNIFPDGTEGRGPKDDLADARKLIEQYGYWRRKEELEDAEEASKKWT